MPEKPASLSFQFGSLRVLIRTNREDYFRYLKQYFGHLPATDHFPELSIDACWLAPKAIAEEVRSWRKNHKPRQVGDDTFLAGKRLLTVKKIGGRTKAVYIFDQSESGRLSVTVFFQWKGLKDLLRQKLLGKAKEDFFYTISFPVVYYPIFWCMEIFHHSHMLHASGVSIQKRGIVFCGMEGIGKTTAALDLLDHGDFLSDNLIFFNHEVISPCFELVRVCCGDDLGRMEEHFERVGGFNTLKTYYRPRFSSRVSQVRPSLFIFPEFSEAPGQQQLTAKEASQAALTLSFLPSELGQYVDFRHFAMLLNPERNLWQEEFQTLQTLMQSARCLRLSMCKADGLEQNLRRIREIVA